MTKLLRNDKNLKMFTNYEFIYKVVYAGNYFHNMFDDGILEFESFQVASNGL